MKGHHWDEVLNEAELDGQTKTSGARDVPQHGGQQVAQVMQVP